MHVVAAKPKATPAASTAAAAAPAPAKAEPGGNEVLVSKAQIKVAHILSAERQPNSDKLLKLKADLGSGDHRQIMAGLQQYLTPEELIGRLVCVVSNLKPAKLAGELSEAMILAAEAQSNGAVIVRPLVPPGKHI